MFDIEFIVHNRRLVALLKKMCNAQLVANQLCVRDFINRTVSFLLL